MKSLASATPIAHSSQSTPPTESIASIPGIQQPPGFDINLLPSPPSSLSPISPILSPNSCKQGLLIHQILGLPPPISNRGKSEAGHRIAAVEGNPNAETLGRHKSRRAGCGSPRNPRRCRRKTISEIEETEQPQMIQESETTNRGRRRCSCRVRKPRLSLIHSTSIIRSPKIDDDNDQRCLDRIERQLSDLVMWKNIAKSSLWFGIGSLFFLSSCFAAGGLIGFSFISAISKVGLLWLGLSFIHNTCFQRCGGNGERKWENKKLREEDVLRALKLLLPVVNFAVSKTREIFSGGPSITIKVAPIFLLGSEYGRFLTVWRLFAFGFFASFTLPKLWSLHSTEMRRQADHLFLKVFGAWSACSHKKLVAVSAITLFWNLTCVKFRVLAVFLGLAMLRCRQQRKLKRGIRA